jgi:ribosome-binding protein aMBF1 (putative translation factor)
LARKKLPRGWTQGSVRDLLDLRDDEAAIVEMRVGLAARVREKRLEAGVTQKELAQRIGSTQPRVARLEQADASLEMLIRALLALGCDRREIARLVAA